MPRLFVGTKEINFFNDIAREIMKDIVGSTIIYFSLDYAKTMVHDLYQESPEKVFAHGVEVAARIDWKPTEVLTNQFGHDETRTMDVYIHVRDMIEKKIKIRTGDYISFGETFYEITAAVFNDIVFGQVEYRMAYKLTCVQARENDFIAKIVGPTWEGYSDPDAVKNNFYQQRGFEHNKEGPTGDIRDLRKNGILERPLGGPREISERADDIPHQSSFYSEPDDEPADGE